MTRRTKRHIYGGTAIAALVLAIAIPAPAAAPIPNYRATVVRARAEYAALAGRQRAFCVISRVAWELRREGAGLFFKTGENSYGERSSDVLMFVPGGQTFDVLEDAEGRAGPAWAPTKPTGHGDVAKWRAPVDPASLAACGAPQGPPPPPPPPPPVATCPPAPVCPVCPPDQGATVTRLREELAAEVDARHAVEAKLAAVTCSASVFGVRVGCKVNR